MLVGPFQPHENTFGLYCGLELCSGWRVSHFWLIDVPGGAAGPVVRKPTTIARVPSTHDAVFKINYD